MEPEKAQVEWPGLFAYWGYDSAFFDANILWLRHLAESAFYCYLNEILGN
jgi:hypothetical protein